MGTARFEVVGDFGRHDVDVAIRCPKCRHTRRLTCSQLYVIFGFGERIYRAQRRCVCSKCGERGARFAPVPKLETPERS